MLADSIKTLVLNSTEKRREMLRAGNLEILEVEIT